MQSVEERRRNRLFSILFGSTSKYSSLSQDKHSLLPGNAVHTELARLHFNSLVDAMSANLGVGTGG